MTELDVTHPLHGRRILHFMSPTRWRGSHFEHEKCSNSKTTDKLLSWLPMCHHYLMVPENNSIPNDRNNVTLLPYGYAQSVILGRAHFNGKQLIKSFNWRAMDIDFIFNHQPEQTYNIMNAIQSGRYGAHVKLFNFFHWLDTPETKPVDVFPDGFIRQLEAIHLADKTFFHNEGCLDYIQKNFTRRNKEASVTGINFPFVKERVVYMPTGVNHDIEPEAFQLPKDKKILVFNHRWAGTSGTNKLIEYTKNLSDEYLVWVTDGNARNPRAGEPAPSNFHVESLDYAKYLYLIQNCHATICFIHGYMTWNLSVQDAVTFNKPSLVFEHPTHKYVFGDNYPYTFKTEEEFLKLVNHVSSYIDVFGELAKIDQWKLPPHDETFKKNLTDAMTETLEKTRVPVSKYNNEWYYHILKLQDNAYKVHLLKNSHPDLYSSNVWEGLRLKCMEMGICDDPTSKFTRLFVPNETVKRKLLIEIVNLKFDETRIDIEFEKQEIQNDIKESIKKKIVRERANNSRAVEFFNF